jgi:hypothetical protein
MTGAWDDHWGGGIYWDKYHGEPDRDGAGPVPGGWKGRPYKNAIANALFIAVGASMAVRYRRQDSSGTGYQDYLQWARRGWNWFSSPPPDGVAMINAANLVNDSPNTDGVNDNTKII